MRNFKELGYVCDRARTKTGRFDSPMNQPARAGAAGTGGSNLSVLDNPHHQQNKDAGTISAEDMLDGHRVSVLIPCLNEAESVPFVLRTMPSWVHEVVIIDDHCTDDTVAVARAVMPSVTIAANRRAPGKGNALKAGMEAASGDILVQVDADGS